MADLLPLPYGRHLIDDADLAAVAAVLRGDWLTTGPAVTAFEDALAERVGARHVVVCSSGTAALHLAALALDLGAGDRAVVPAVTFAATANACKYVGCEPVFSDVDPDNGLMRPDDLQQVLSNAAADGAALKAVFPVHLTGQCVDMAGIHALAQAHGLFIVEDASHALGTTFDAADSGRGAVGCCQYSDIAVFSFHPVKTIAMGEGGAVATNDDALYERLRRFRNHGLVRETARFENTDLAYDASGEVNPWYYELQDLGFNYRASDIVCALGMSQLGKLDQFVDRRRELVARYDRLLAPLAPHIRAISRVPDCQPAWHLYVALIDFEALGLERGNVMRLLADEGIHTQVHYIPLYHHPYYAKHSNRPLQAGAEAYYARCLTLPLHPGLKDEDVDRVVGTLRRILELND